MANGRATPPASGNFAQWLANRFMERLASIDHTLTRMLELQQSPRTLLDVQGTVAGGGTVGITPASCTVAPPLGTSPGTILARNPHRRGLSVQNLSAAGGPNLTLGLGVQTPIANTGWVLMPGQSWDGRISGEVWTGSVTVVASVAGCTFAFGVSSGPNQRGRNEAV
jgi:hypothetical protein